MAQICQEWLPPIFKSSKSNSMIGCKDFAAAAGLVTSFDFVKLVHRVE